MEPGRASVTALIGALIRAHHYEHGQPHILEDAFAHRLLEPSERRALEDGIIDAWVPANRNPSTASSDRGAALAAAHREGGAAAVVLARARFTEDALLASRPEGVRQYVLIGAGMDMFAFRRPELMCAVEVFEIDHPATQAAKQQRLARARLEVPRNLHFIPADLEQQSLASVLASSTLDPTRPTFFAWLGVTHYLTRDAIAATLRTVRSAAAPRSRLAFDYVDLDAFVPGKAAPRVTRMMERTRRLGEPVISGFDPSSLGAELGTFGFQLIEHLSPREIDVRYFASRPDGLHATEHSYFACALVLSG